MGYCRECSCYVPDTAKFCNVCGSSNLERSSSAKVVEEKPVEVKPVVVTPTFQAPVVSYSFVERGPWKVFAKVGFVLGLITFIGGMLCTVCLPLMLLADSVAFLAILALLGVFGFIVAMMTFEAGTVFSILGIKSSMRRKKAIIGLIFSLVGFIVPLIIFIMVDVSLAL